MTVYDFKNFKKANPITKRIKRFKVTSAGCAVAGLVVGVLAAHNRARQTNGTDHFGTFIDTVYYGMFMGAMGATAGHMIGNVIEHRQKQR